VGNPGETFPIEHEADIVTVRRYAKEVAHRLGLDAFATAALTTAASELARNVWMHAKTGSATIEEVEREGRVGIRMIFVDQGPGIADIERALAGGYSTARSLGLGLSGSRRLVDEFHVQTAPGDGTRIEVIKWARR
jgi:serine/threonine-protein kinase RsbT